MQTTTPSLFEKIIVATLVALLDVFMVVGIILVILGVAGANLSLSITQLNISLTATPVYFIVAGVVIALLPWCFGALAKKLYSAPLSQIHTKDIKKN